MNRTENPKVHHNFKHINVFLYLLGLVALVTLVFVLVTAIGGEGRTITVDDSGGANYTKIQDAVDAAEDGDTIRVYEGTYSYSVVVNKTLSLVGNGSANTIIDGLIDRGGDMVQIEADGCNMSGFGVIWCDVGIWIESNHTRVFENNFSNNNYGIYLYESSNNTLSRNTYYSNDHGICLDVSDNNTLDNNTCSNNDGSGIYLFESDHNTLMNNTCSNNYNDGIRLSDSTSNIFSNNTLFGNNDGILLYGSSMNNIAHYNNIFNNTDYGINATNNDGYTINAENNWWGDASGPYHPVNNSDGKGDNVTDYVEFDPWLGKYAFLTKYVDDDAQDGGDGSMKKPFNKIQDAIDDVPEGGTIYVFNGTYYENVVVNKTVSLIGNGSDVTTIDAGGEGSVVKIEGDWCNVSGFTLTGCGINYTYEDAGIRIYHSDNVKIFENNCSNNGWHGVFLRDSDFCTITNTICSNNGHCGICLGRTNYSTISNTTCLNNGDSGIDLDGCDNNTISNNTCSNNSAGITIRYSNGNTLTNNTCTNTGSWGIRLYNSNNNTLFNNTCLDNDDRGIYLQRSNDNILNNNTIENNDYGIRLRYSDNNTITNNTSENNDNGINLNDSDNNSLSYNTVSGNNIGIYLKYSSQNNAAHYNNIFNNVDHGIDARDSNGYTINATHNWWGDNSGPYHPTKNPTGKGDNVTDYVDFHPWLLTNPSANKIPLAFIDSINPNPGIEGQIITFSGHGTDDGSIVRYYWRSNLGNELYNGASPTFITSRLSPGYHTIYFRVKDDFGVWSEEASSDLTILPKPPENQLPVLTILSPENNSEISGIVSIRGTVYDPEGNSASVEISINGGEWFRITNASSWNFQFDTRELKDGSCLIRVRAYDGQNYSETQTLNLTVKNEGGGSGGVPLPGPTLTAVGIVAVGLFGLAYLREDLRFAILSILTIPLYTTLKKDDILNQANRRDIYTYLASNPGANYTRILKELNLGTSTLVHHLKVLEREGFIRSKKAMGRRLFSPRDSRLRVGPDTFELPLSPIQTQIRDYLKDNGPASRLDIEHALSLKRQTVGYSVRRLEERGLIKCSGDGRKDMCKAV